MAPERYPMEIPIPANTRRRGLYEDGSSSSLINFPFALNISFLLVSGLSGIGWGMILASAWLAVVGVILTLFGSFLFGWSLYDE